MLHSPECHMGGCERPARWVSTINVPDTTGGFVKLRTHQAICEHHQSRIGLSDMLTDKVWRDLRFDLSMQGIPLAPNRDRAQLVWTESR